MRPILLKTGSTFPELSARKGDFEDWFARGLGWPLSRLHVVDVVTGGTLPDPANADPVLVTGSSAHVHDHDAWSVRTGEWLAAAARAGVPILGVCYGHQLLADALGGDVGPNPKGREIGVCEVEVVLADPLFEGLPSRFPVIQTHSDAVNAPPAGADVLARNANSSAQAMRFGAARTTQWHPEFDADAIRHYISARAEVIDAESGAGTAARLLGRVVEVDTGPVILRNFFERCL